MERRTSENNVSMNSQSSIDESVLYDVEFADDVVDDDFHCSVCLEVLRNPVQIVPCGHRFCRLCLDNLISASKGSTKCPIDRDEISADRIFPDNNFRRKIMSIKVVCRHASLGCNWVSEWSGYESHLSKHCLYEDDACGNEGCGEQFLRKYKVDHEKKNCKWRIMKCSFCYDMIRLFEQEEHMKLHCPSKPVPCPNAGCRVAIQRCMVIYHTDNDCQYSVQKCPLGFLGCLLKAPRKQVEEHMQQNSKHHIELLCGKIQLLSLQLEKCSKENQNLLRSKSVSDQVKNEEPKKLVYIWHLQDFGNVAYFQEIGSPLYCTGDRGYPFCIALLKRKTDTVISIRMIPGLYDNLLPWPCKCDFSLYLLDQDSAAGPQHIGRQYSFDPDDRVPHCFEKPEKNAFGSTLYPLLVILNEKLEDQRYSHDDTHMLLVKVSAYNVEDNLADLA